MVTRARIVLTAIALVCAAILPAQETPFVPGDLGDAEMSRIVPDTVTFTPPDGKSNLNNWEPYASVLGGLAFLIESNKFAIDPENPGAENQSYGIVFQRIDGSPPVRNECFYTDEGEPHAGPINHSRQNGNPGRVAGDPRPGAYTLVCGGETSIHEVPEFQEDGRWDQGSFVRGDTARFATVQVYTWDPLAGTQTPVAHAFDAILGHLLDGVAAGPEITRFGGDIVGLDNGDFAVVVEDRSGLIDPLRSVTAAIVAPDGSLIREAFSIVSDASIWANVAAHQDGFCVRATGQLFFLDTVGDYVDQRDQHDSGLHNAAHGQPIYFDSGRGDSTRIAGHVNSPYVFLAGPTRACDEEGNWIEQDPKVLGDVWLAAFDSRDLSFVASTPVNELTEELGGVDAEAFRHGVDRVNLAVDALNRVCVSWEVYFEAGVDRMQTVARDFELDDEAPTFRPLTPSFFPFVNHSPPPDGTRFRTLRPSVAMTTEAICIAAKGEINLANDPAEGPDSPEQTNFYTVFSHPDPREDPTPPVRVGPFVRGGANTDGTEDLSDAISIFNFLFLGGLEPPCLAAADLNGDGAVDISDGIYLLNFLFVGGPAPPTPHPDLKFADDDESKALGCKNPVWPVEDPAG